MSDTTSGDSRNSVEGGKPPSTTSSWPITEIGGSEAGDNQSTSVSPASSSLPSSPKLAPAASKGTITSVVKVIDGTSDAATELHGAGTSLESTPSTTADKQDEVAESLALPAVKGDGAVSGGDKQDPVDAPDDIATPQATAASGDATENTTTSVASEEVSASGLTTTEPATQSGTEEPKAAEHDKPTGQSHPKVRPAFVLTRPTENGRNEEAAVPPPGAPSSTTPSREETPTRDAPANESTEGQGPGTSRPTPKITTLLSDIEQFSTSPVAVTATSPRTRAFFATDYSAAMRSPPRPGGAVITEIASDTEFTIVDSKTEYGRRALPERLSREAGPEREHKRAVPAKNRSDGRAEGRPEIGRCFEPSPTKHSSSQSFRLPFVIGRTVVSAAVPRLMRDESLRQQRLRDYDRQLEAERQREKMRVLSERRIQQEERERQRQRERLLQAEALELLRRREEVKRQRAAAFERPAPPAPTPPVREESPLQALILELKAGLEADPAVYYAVRGVLNEYEEQTGRRPARASSVDEPSTRRTVRQHERRREPLRQEPVDGSSRDPARRRPQVSFDEDSSTTERPPIVPPSAPKIRDHDGVRTALKKTAGSGTRSAFPPQQHDAHVARTAEGGRLPHSERPRVKPNTIEKPHATVRRAAAREQDGRAAAKRPVTSSRNDPSAITSAALTRAEQSRLQRRHSFDSIVDYKPTQGLKTEKKHESGSAPPRQGLYDGPRGLMRAPLTAAEHATKRHVDVPASITFSLADIQSVDGSSKRKVKPAAGQAVRSESRKSRQAAIVQPSTTGRSTVSRTSTVPYAQARWPARDDSITFDFDDFY